MTWTEPARKHAGAGDLDLLTAQIPQLAAGHQLRIVPATPAGLSGSCHLVLLDQADLSAAEFCELAAAARARLLYVQADAFDAGSDNGLELWPRGGAEPWAADDALAGLRRDALRCNGRIRQLELAFAVEGVLHTWTVAADWYDHLTERATALPDREFHESWGLVFPETGA